MWCYSTPVFCGYFSIVFDVNSEPQGIFQKCYGLGFVAKDVRDWINPVGSQNGYIEPSTP